MKAPRYPGYDVLAKQRTPSWDEVTRAVIQERMAPSPAPTFCDSLEWQTLQALCAAVVPRGDGLPVIPTAHLVDARLAVNSGDGYRDARLPTLQTAWRIGLGALDVACRDISGAAFAFASAAQRTALLQLMEQGLLSGDAWKGMPPEVFFKNRVLPDICGAYYAHPYAWNEMGFGGPANPRGYVRLGFDRRDPWEAAEAGDDPERARRENRRVR